jgi:hypothetical protein
MSQWQFISNQIQVFGISQFIKIATSYTKRKLLNAISFNDEYSVAKVAKSNGIPLIKTYSLRSQSFIEEISSLSLDIIISIASSGAIMYILDYNKKNNIPLSNRDSLYIMIDNIHGITSTVKEFHNEINTSSDEDLAEPKK